MPITDAAVSIIKQTTPLLTCPAGLTFGTTITTGVVSAAKARGYIASVEGYLWGHDQGDWRVRMNAIKANAELKYWLGQRDTDTTAYVEHPVAGLVLPVVQQLRRVDKLILDMKAAAGQPFRFTPVTENIARDLTRPTTAEKDRLAEVIALFDIARCLANETPVVTVCSLSPPNTTYRIDREVLNPHDGRQYWTYRLQKGSPTHGGIQMEVGVTFPVADLREAFTDSLNSVPLKAAGQSATATGFYVRVSYPTWLRQIEEA